MISDVIHSKKLPGRFLFFGVVTLLLSACGGGVVGNANNYVLVDDQSIIHLNEITLTKASVEQTVCLVVFEPSVISDDMRGNVVIGEMTLTPGTYQDITMTLTRDVREHESLFAELREAACGVENGSILTSEIVVAQGAVAARQFTVTRSNIPYIEVRDQTLSRVGGGGIRVNKVITHHSAWLVAHRYEANESQSLGSILGYQLIDNGHSKNVSVMLNEELTGDTDVVFALYENVNQTALETENFDEAEDLVMRDAPTVIITVTPAQ